MSDAAFAAPDVQATFCATLVDEWMHAGMRHAVIAPGSRSTPMAVALADRRDLAVHVFHDERAAAFAALGIARASGTPAALLCTSGTAATHFHAAVVEAHQSGVPMLVLTADRPPELRGVGAPQTIDQLDLYGSAVRWFVDADVPDWNQRDWWRELALTAWSKATGDSAGPVHLNLPFREPLLGQALELPDRGGAMAMESTETPEPDLAALLGSRGVIVAGNGVDDPIAVAALADATGWPVLADPMSRCQHLKAAVVRFDAVLRNAAFCADHRPEVVLQLGMPPASKVMAQWLAASGAVHVAVSPTGLVSDPNLVGARQVHATIGALCRRLAGSAVAPVDPGWCREWVAADVAARRAIDVALDAEPELSDPGVARAVTAAVPSGGHLVVASSMPVRDVEWFGTPRSDVTVHANRGANGIDGVMSTAIGVAIGSEAPTVVLLGDIAFGHDLSALVALAARQLTLTIVVNDNDGGAIFSFLPQATGLSTERFEQLFGTPHGTDVVAVARAFGLRASDIDNAEELQAMIRDGGTAVVRVRTDRRRNVDVHAALNEAAVAAIG